MFLLLANASLILIFSLSMIHLISFYRSEGSELVSEVSAIILRFPRPFSSTLSFLTTALNKAFDTAVFEVLLLMGGLLMGVLLFLEARLFPSMTPERQHLLACYIGEV